MPVEEYFRDAPENQFPKYLKHAMGGAQIVNSQHEQDELGEGWFENLVDMGVETCPAQKPEDVKGNAIMPGFVASPAVLEKVQAAQAARSVGGQGPQRPSAQVAPAGTGPGEERSGRGRS